MSSDVWIFFPPSKPPSPGWSGVAQRLHPKLCSPPTDLSEAFNDHLIADFMGTLHVGSPKPKQEQIGSKPWGFLFFVYEKYASENGSPKALHP